MTTYAYLSELIRPSITKYFKIARRLAYARVKIACNSLAYVLCRSSSSLRSTHLLQRSLLKASSARRGAAGKAPPRRRRKMTGSKEAATSCSTTPITMIVSRIVRVSNHSLGVPVRDSEQKKQDEKADEWNHLSLYGHPSSSKRHTQGRGTTRRRPTTELSSLPLSSWQTISLLLLLNRSTSSTHYHSSRGV
jgi:hypothetical protein